MITLWKKVPIIEREVTSVFTRSYFLKSIITGLVE
jgi:hypothetical protein